MIHRFESHKDPFKGLAIEQLEKDWTERLVLLFGLASGKHMEEDTLHSYLLYLLHENEKRWDIECQESALTSD